MLQGDCTTASRLRPCQSHQSLQAVSETCFKQMIEDKILYEYCRDGGCWQWLNLKVRALMPWLQPAKKGASDGLSRYGDTISHQEKKCLLIYRDIRKLLMLTRSLVIAVVGWVSWLQTRQNQQSDSPEDERIRRSERKIRANVRELLLLLKLMEVLQDVASDEEEGGGGWGSLCNIRQLERANSRLTRSYRHMDQLSKYSGHCQRKFWYCVRVDEAVMWCCRGWGRWVGACQSQASQLKREDQEKTHERRSTLW